MNKGFHIKIIVVICLQLLGSFFWELNMSLVLSQYIPSF